MTTIAYKSGILAADTQLTIDAHVKMICHKHTFLKDGSVIAVAGNVGTEEQFLRFLNTKKDPPMDKGVKKLGAIRVYPNGKVTFYDSSVEELPMEHSFHAVGIGHEFARAAMALGLSALEAVKFASEMDIYTNNIIDTWNWKTKKYIKG